MTKKVLMCMTDASFEKMTYIMIRSFLQHNKDFEVVVFAYGDLNFLKGRFNTIRLDTPEFITPGKYEFSLYERIESCRSLAVLKLFDIGYDEVFYSDSDLFYYSKLPEFDNDSFVITPHFINYRNLCSPMAFSSFTISGFVNGGIYRICKNEESFMFFSMLHELTKSRIQGVNCNFNSKTMWQQTIFDKIPWMFKKYEISDNFGLNVAYWNLKERTIFKNNGQFEVAMKGKDKLPLVCFHFSGLLRNEPERLSKYTQQKISETGESSEALTEIFSNYRKLLFG